MDNMKSMFGIGRTSANKNSSNDAKNNRMKTNPNDYLYDAN